MDERASGLILRVYPLTETSLIIHWLTQALGRIATVAKGARRTKSPFRGKLDLFYGAEFTFARSRRSELHTLREISLRETHSALRRDLGILQQASYCAALVEQATEKETPLPAIFELMNGLLKYLPTQSAQAQTVFSFELKLLDELGLAPDLAKSKLTEGARQFAKAFSNDDWSMLSRFKITEAQSRELGQFLHGFLIFHLGKIPKGRGNAVGS
jgi:DNA repair protein RecO (recombination protein O)